MSANSLYEKFMIVKEEASNIYSSISCIKGIHIAYLVETMQKLDGEEESMLNTCANKMKTFSNQRKEARVRQENVKVIRQIMLFFVSLWFQLCQDALCLQTLSLLWEEDYIDIYNHGGVSMEMQSVIPFLEIINEKTKLTYPDLI